MGSIAQEGFPGGSDGKTNLPAIWETWARSLAWEDPLEKEMATHSSIPAWSIPWTEEPGGLQSVGLQSQTRLSDWARCSSGKTSGLNILESVG